MKKCIFIIVAMFVATYANAQIVVNSRFKSMTFDEMAAPLIMAQRFQQECLNNLDALAEQTEQAEQFIENFGIDLDKIRITDNTYSDRINNQVSLYTYTAYGSTSMGWRGTLYLTSLVNNSTTPFDWEEF